VCMVCSVGLSVGVDCVGGRGHMLTGWGRIG
jgi:hypothetical protein